MAIRSTYFFLCVLFLTLTQHISASPTFRNTDEDALFNELYEETLKEFDEIDQFRGDYCLTPEEILQLLLGSNMFNLALLLRNDRYLRTNPIVVRNIVDSPIIGRTRLHDEDLILQAELFYQHIEQGYFTRRSRFIDSIISFNDDDLQNFLPQVGELLNLQGIPELVGIFRNLKIQERQAGIMCSIAGNYETWHLSGRFPFYWIENNFFLTPLEQNSVENSPLFANMSMSEEEREQLEEFFKRLFVADRLGLGDTRLKLEHLAYSTPSLQAYAGLSLTIPTAATISRGLLGGKFDKPLRRPEFSIAQVIELAMCDRNFEQAKEEVVNFAIGAACQLTSNIADRGLGNGGHWGFAPTIDIYNRVAERMGLELYAALEYLTPHTERRYFIEKKDVARLNMIASDFESFTEEEAAVALAFLNEQLINTFYPFVVRTSVQPGVLMKIRPAVHMEIERFAGWVGYDFWWQANESIGKIDAPAALKNKLRIQRGRKPRAEQHRIWFDFRCYAFSNEYFDWQFALKADCTVRSLGIGDSVALSLAIQGAF